jgi:hypothetical protein
MSNPLDPEVMSPAERLEEAASLLARGILRRRLRTADGRKPALSVYPERSRGAVEGKPLDVLREARDECVEPQSEGRDT